MFCDGCGAGLQPDQSFCGRCGKEVKGGVHLAYPRTGRVQQHVRLLGILWLGLAALNVIGGIVLFILANTLFVHLSDVPGFLHPLLSFVAVLVLMKAVAGFATGWGLLQREPWARTLALILGFISLFNIPFGTALGVYTLWVLLPTESEREYAAQVRAA